VGIETERAPSPVRGGRASLSSRASDFRDIQAKGIEEAVDRYVAMTRATQQLVSLTGS
jgi:hypothetical protein